MYCLNEAKQDTGIGQTKQIYRSPGADQDSVPFIEHGKKQRLREGKCVWGHKALLGREAEQSPAHLQDLNIKGNSERDGEGEFVDIGP